MPPKLRKLFKVLEKAGFRDWGQEESNKTKYSESFYAMVSHLFQSRAYFRRYAPKAAFTSILLCNMRTILILWLSICW